MPRSWRSSSLLPLVLRGCLLLAAVSAGGACAKSSSSTEPASAKTPPPSAAGRAVKLHELDGPGVRWGKARLLGTVELGDRSASGAEVHELSGLAWDERHSVLYAVSDRGVLHHITPLFDGEQLVGAQVVKSFPLTDGGQPLTHELRDSEGLQLEAEGTLLVSFEKTPRVMRFDVEGRARATLAAPALSELSRYDAENHALEGMAVHPELGILVAPERDVPGLPKGVVPFWNLKGEEVARFSGGGSKKSAVVAFEVLEDGSWIVLEREYRKKSDRLKSALYQAWPAGPGVNMRTDRLLFFDTAEGWQHDNYEGLARHRGQRFFLVTDDNGGGKQRTLLTYVELSLRGSSKPASKTPPPVSPKAGGEEP